MDLPNFDVLKQMIQDSIDAEVEKLKQMSSQIYWTECSKTFGAIEAYRQVLAHIEALEVSAQVSGIIESA